jgi:hypothetical protein
MLWIHLILVRIRIHLFFSVWIRIRIQGAKAIWIHSDPDLSKDPGQTLKSQKVELLHWKYNQSR